MSTIGPSYEQLPGSIRPSLREAIGFVGLLLDNRETLQQHARRIAWKFGEVKRFTAPLQEAASSVAYAGAVLESEARGGNVTAFKKGVNIGILISSPWYGAELPGLRVAIGTQASQIRLNIKASCPDGLDFFTTERTRGDYLVSLGEHGLSQVPELDDDALATLAKGASIADYLQDIFSAGIGSPLYFLADLYDQAARRQIEASLQICETDDLYVDATLRAFYASSDQID